MRKQRQDNKSKHRSAPLRTKINNARSGAPQRMLKQHKVGKSAKRSRWLFGVVAVLGLIGVVFMCHIAYHYELLQVVAKQHQQSSGSIRSIKAVNFNFYSKL